MKQRIITALIALPVLLASFLIQFLAPLFVLLVLAALTLGLHEFWVMAKKRGHEPQAAIGYIAAATIFLCFYLTDTTTLPLLLLLVMPAAVITVLINATLKGAPFEKMMMSCGVTLLGVGWVFLLGSHLIGVRVGFPFVLGKHLLAFFFLILMGSDSGAYFAGRAFGSHKLAPKISPGKTWEGAIGGMLTSLLFAALAHAWFFPELPLKWALPLAAAMTILGVLGDLAESAVKRGADVKDAASLLPGHGGLLDRLDSLLFSAPLLYYFARFYFSSF